MSGFRLNSFQEVGKVKIVVLIVAVVVVLVGSVVDVRINMLHTGCSQPVREELKKKTPGGPGQQRVVPAGLDASRC